MTYRLNDCDDLVGALLLLRSLEVRQVLERRGVEKMQNEFSWEAVARHHYRAYETALNGRGN